MGPELPWPNGARGARGAQQARFEVLKKPNPLNRPGLGNGYGPTSQVRVLKNPPQT